jgi:phytoene synthase
MPPDHPERALVLTYAPGEPARRALVALLALDDRLAETVRTTSEPMLGQIRLKWWQEALAGLDSAAAPAEPVLQTVQRDVIAHGVTGAELAAIAEAWDEVLGEELDDAAIDRFAMRGRALFAAAGRVAGAAADDPLAPAGAGWALADLAQGLSDAGEAERVRAAATAVLQDALSSRWSRNGRALGAMAHLARLDLAGVPSGAPRRVGRALWHRMTGR